MYINETRRTQVRVGHLIGVVSGDREVGSEAGVVRESLKDMACGEALKMWVGIDQVERNVERNTHTIFLKPGGMPGSPWRASIKCQLLGPLHTNSSRHSVWTRAF